jgi:hypothetical protein
MYGTRSLAFKVMEDAEYGTSNPAAHFHFHPRPSQLDGARLHRRNIIRLY